MRILNQVCTPEQGKRFIGLGFYAPSLFVYFKAASHSGFALGNMYMRHISILTGNAYEEKDVNVTPVYTAAELGEMLPEEQAYKFFSSHYNEHFGSWCCEFRGFKSEKEFEQWDSASAPPLLHETEEDTEAQARAEMLIWLLETKIVTVEEINKRIMEHV